MSRSIPISRFLIICLGLVWALQCWYAWGATILVETAHKGDHVKIWSGIGHTIEEAEADLRGAMEVMAKFGDPVEKVKELARCSGGGYSAYASYWRGEGGLFGSVLGVCGHPSWESALLAVKANCMRESANYPMAHRYDSSPCAPFPMDNDRFQTKERWFFSSWFNNSKPSDTPKPAPQVTTGTRSYDGRYAPDCTKIGLALDIHGDNMTVSENGRVLFTQKGKLHIDYWGRTPPPGSEAGFVGERHGDAAFELMREAGGFFGNIRSSKQLEAAMTGRPLKGYRYCGQTCNAGAVAVSNGNIVCRR